MLFPSVGLLYVSEQLLKLVNQHRSIHSFSSDATINQPINFLILSSPPMWMILQLLSNSNRAAFGSIFHGLAVEDRTIRRLWLDYSSRPCVIDTIKMSILLLC